MSTLTVNASFLKNGSFNESKLAELLDSAPDCDTLEKMYRDVLHRNQQHVPTLHNYGNLLMRIRQNFTEAEIKYKEVMKINPAHVPTLCNFGNLLHNNLGRPDLAEAMYTKALSLDPGHSTTLCNLGYLKQTVHSDLTATEHLYRQALEYDSNHTTALYNYGRLLQVRRRRFRGWCAADATFSHLTPLSLNFSLSLFLLQSAEEALRRACLAGLG